MNQDFAWVLSHAGRYDESISQFEKVLEMEPTFTHAHFGLGFNYLQKGLPEKAISEYQKFVKATGDSDYALGILGWAYGILDRKKEALKILDTIKERTKRESVDTSAFALIYAGLGEKDQAIDWLYKAYEQRNSHLLIWSNVEGSLYRKLHSDPRYWELLQKIGLIK